MDKAIDLVPQLSHVQIAKLRVFFMAGDLAAVSEKLCSHPAGGMASKVVL